MKSGTPLLISVIVAVLFSLTISVLSQSQGIPRLFDDAPWRGFDTGAFPNGFGPKSLATGDLDADGDADVLLGNAYFGGPGLSVLKNLGDGTYDQPVRYALPNNQSVGEVALSDFDRDGDLDAVATIPDGFGFGNKLGVWRNNGDGTLAPRVEYTTGEGPVGLIVADFTGDGFADIANANYRSGTVSLLRHNGQSGAGAGFLASVQFTSGRNSERLAAADLNGDGRLDLAVGRIDDVVSGLTYTVSMQSVLLNNGSGGFNAPAHYIPIPPPSRGATTAVALADLDNDGDVDLIGGAALDQGSITYGVVVVRRNNGNGTFGEPEQHRLNDFVFTPRHITTADLNGDGLQDIIAATPSGRGSDGYNVLLNNGAGGFQTATFYHASQQTYATVANDADRDGDQDIITVANSSAAITVHKNPGNGVFPTPTGYRVGNLTEAQEFADIDRDGDQDIVTNDDSVRILKNNGNGTFAPATIYLPPRNFADMKLRDLNGDGFVDLLLGPDAEFPPYHSGTALNNGNGTFAPGVVRQVFSCGQGTIDAFDLDTDGDLDVVLTEEQGCAGGQQRRIFIFRNDGPQTFFAMAPIIPPGGAFGIAGADVTGDGKVDLITSLGQGIGVFPGNGDLTFGPPIISSTQPYKFTLNDFNRDGKLDVGMIVPQGSFGTVLVGTAIGNGDGTFQPAQTQTGSSVLETAFRISDNIDAGDADQDGDPDLVVSNNASNDVSVFINNGDGTLRPHQRYGVGYAPQFSVIADFTGDGVPDIAPVISLPPSGVQNSVIIMRGLTTTTPPADSIQVVLSRDASNNLRATVTITNPTAGAISGVTMTLVRASTLDGSAFVDGTPVPQSFGTVNPGQSVVATVTFPGTASVPSGFSGLVRVDLSYTGGTYTESEQVVTP